MSSKPSSDARTTPVLLIGVDFGAPHFDADLQELGLLAQTAAKTPEERAQAPQLQAALRALAERIEKGAKTPKSEKTDKDNQQIVTVWGL